VSSWFILSQIRRARTPGRAFPPSGVLRLYADRPSGQVLGSETIAPRGELHTWLDARDAGPITELALAPGHRLCFTTV
jgi:hypothetical protein